MSILNNPENYTEAAIAERKKPKTRPPEEVREELQKDLKKASQLLSFYCKKYFFCAIKPPKY